MKILLTGGTGLLGTEIAKHLVARGDSIVLLVRNSRTVKDRLAYPATCFEWSHESSVPLEALHGVEAVINLSGEPVADGRWTDKKKRLIRDSRVLGTRQLVQAVSKHAPGIKTFVQGSAIGIYGERGDDLLDADSVNGSGFLAEVVRDWEAEALVLNTTNTRVPIVRTAVVLARHGGALHKMLPIFRANMGGRLGFKGHQWMSWIHINDVVRLFIHALDSERVTGILEGAAPEPVTNKVFTEVLARELDVLENIPVPRFALEVLYGEMANVILESARVVPTRTMANDFKFEYETLESAMKNLLQPLRGSIFEKLSEQWIPKRPDEVWPYFCDAKNLETLTPDFLKFKVKAMSTPEVQEGSLIDYTLSLNGIPFHWRTKIEEWQPDRKFVDTQLSGPYALWHHTHEFIPMAGGTLLRDRVLYRVPFGWLGAMASGWKVHRDVAMIFDFRRKKIAELFGN